MDDSGTYPWLLQAIIPTYHVKNFAVPGYGVSNVYTQLKSVVQIDSGDIVLYAYFAQHNNRYERRVLKLISEREDLIGSIGYVLLDDSLHVSLHKNDYKVWQLSRFSALFNFLEDSYNKFADSRENYSTIALRAITEMNRWCKKRGATFAVLGILDDSNTKLMLQSFSLAGVPCLDISVDLNDPRYYSLPDDKHPNIAANKLFVKRIYNYLVNEAIIDNKHHASVNR